MQASFYNLQTIELPSRKKLQPAVSFPFSLLSHRTNCNPVSTVQFTLILSG
jgi:hypothetical protein